LWDRYEHEAQRRQVERFVGRGNNFSAWTLCSLGALDAAREFSEAALGAGDAVIAETTLSAHHDLADRALHAGDVDTAAAHLERSAVAVAEPSLIFGWRLRCKQRWHEARLAFARDDFDEAATLAAVLADDAARLRIDRYAVPARILVARARCRSGDTVASDAIASDVDRLTDVVAIEAWWLTAEAARDLRVAQWFALAEQRAATLATAAGEWSTTLQQAAARDIATARNVARV